VTVREYLQPGSLSEAIGLLERHGPELLVIAGGTVAMPLINEGLSLPERVMTLRHIGLDAIDRQDGTLRIGAGVTLTRLLEQDDVPLLREAARHTASWAVRNMATVGGNLFTPSPGGDIAVALLALDAQVQLAGPKGERALPLAGLWTGFMTTALEPDELLVAIGVPLADQETAFVKYGRKAANTPAVVTVAVALRRTHPAGAVEDVRIALGAVGPNPIRARAAERVLQGRPLDDAAIADAADAAAAEAQPFTDAIATEWYRRRMTAVWVRRALHRLAQAGEA
jgi:CO/xanthine dehydrogenase FAD-binding subunit